MSLFELLSFLGLLIGAAFGIWMGAEHGIFAAVLGGALAIPVGMIAGVLLAVGLIAVAHFGIRLEDWLLGRPRRQERPTKKKEFERRS